MMSPYHFNWTSLCGSPEFFVWNSEFHNFGLCFQKLVLEIISHFLLASASAYYIGKQSPWIIRDKSQKGILYVRGFCVWLSLIISILEPWLSVEISSRHLFWVDIASSFVQILSWIVHLGYLHALKYKVSRGTRGPTPVILAWLLTFLFNICYARAAWSDVFQNIPQKDVFVVLFRILTGIQLGSQVLYLCTLFPKGLVKRTHFRDLLTPLPGHARQARSHNYARLQDHDPHHLGVGEDQVNILSYLTFSWVNPLMEKGKQGKLSTTDDVFGLPSYLRTEYISTQVQRQILINQPLSDKDEPSPPKPHFYLFRALFKCFGGKFMKLGLLKFCSDMISFAGPMLLHELVRFLQGQETETWKGYTAGFCLVLANISVVLFSVHYQWALDKLNLQVRGSLETTLFKKIQQVTSAQLSSVSHGEMVNMMTTDTDRIVRFSECFHAFWSMPLQLGITLLLLYTQIGVAFLVGLLITILVVPINALLASQISKFSKKMMNFKDKRVNLMTEILGMIKAVKLNSLENILRRQVMDERHHEVEGLASRKYLDAGCVFLWVVTPVIVPIVTFSVYVALGNPMDPARIFTAVALFNMLVTPLNAYPWVVNGLVESWVSIRRVEKLMRLKETDMKDYYTIVSEMSSPENKVHVLVERGSFSCKSSEEQTSTSSTLKELNLQIEKKKVTGIVGSVGSCKTTLLNSIMGETVKEEGIIAVSSLHEGFAYASQSPWLQNMSIKDNILFGLPFDEDKYKKVIFACCLEEDLHGFALKDETRCGENGASLSGGQKSRVALARAVYQNKSLCLFDDVLSAVDVPVAEHIMQHCIHGLLAEKTVVLITHNLALLTRVDHVIRLSDGRVIQEGTPEEVLTQITDQNIFSNDWVSKMDKSSGAIPRTSKKRPTYKCGNKEFTQRVNEEYLFNLELEEAETRSFGEINSSVFITYFSPIGGALCSAVLFALLLMQASRNITDAWLARWVSHATPPVNATHHTSLGHAWGSHLGINPIESLPNALYRGSSYATMGPIWNNYYQLNAPNRLSMEMTDPTTKFYLMVYGILASMNAIFAFLRAFLYAYAGIKSARVLHKKLLDSVLYAKMTFFDLNPLGRIINRFSSDIYAIDDTLPFQMNIFLAQIFGLLGSIAITMYGVPWILLVYIPLVFLYFNVQQFYRHASRELRRIYSLSLSPLYNHFSETINGLTIIKAMRAGHRFSVLNELYLEENQKAQFSLRVVAVWLNLRLQFIGVIVILGVTVLSLFKNTKEGISPGLVGLVISYSLTMSGFLNGVVTYLTETERELISVERVHQYLTQTPKEREAPGNSRSRAPPLALPSGWPINGKITFDNVYFRYHDHNPFVLRGVTFEVPAGSKVGIRGRTGAGKSSILMALFRMAELCQGRIAIDNVDISDVSLKKLRTTMAIVSQDIVIFTGTVRDNLDVRNMNTDDEIWMAIDQCELRTVIEEMGGLDATLRRRDELSAGQQQLFCLARVLLSRTKIVCIDEGTSQLDTTTDMLIQNAFRGTFEDRTLIVIAHRLETLNGCDIVITMDDGEVKDICHGSELSQSTGARPKVLKK